MYESHLVLGNIDHSEVVFAQYLQEYDENICDDDCEPAYIDGEVLCSTDSGNEEEDEGVPFL
jgi:hypothetical protein